MNSKQRRKNRRKFDRIVAFLMGSDKAPLIEIGMAAKKAADSLKNLSLVFGTLKRHSLPIIPPRAPILIGFDPAYGADKSVVSLRGLDHKLAIIDDPLKDSDAVEQFLTKKLAENMVLSITPDGKPTGIGAKLPNGGHEIIINRSATESEFDQEMNRIKTEVCRSLGVNPSDLDNVQVNTYNAMVERITGQTLQLTYKRKMRPKTEIPKSERLIVVYNDDFMGDYEVEGKFIDYKPRHRGKDRSRFCVFDKKIGSWFPEREQFRTSKGWNYKDEV